MSEKRNTHSIHVLANAERLLHSYRPGGLRHTIGLALLSEIPERIQRTRMFLQAANGSSDEGSTPTAK
ncbi:hypothetical protein A2841_04025 [Candidatus Kaiserbacteria bacterium RIFCSPHIGHO2_01_FULL_48_10]|uniref:Uncharacterized protein n=1 Tax=Candidatus Kaiserbacteria bacterium RIFCSPHIGHO2_01_FULL_48_10 TaxID=1798476 RepID=A0A1F6C4B0_9BACT|nr:MAG: hypothetical protein A2841_04025 [Candidatus Kaiserbacteria bacterium RIFCSPHIGHO2_01_FULL_48_10]